MSLSIKRRLPHRPLGPWPVHVIYRLHGSISKNEWIAHNDWYDTHLQKLEQDFPNRTTIAKEQREFEYRRSELHAAYAKKYDRLLDNKSDGPFWLRHQEIADIVAHSWLDMQAMRRVDIVAFCIMSNHVHIILQSPDEILIRISDILASHKKFTARRANTILKRTGAFWQRDYFDRDVRPNQLHIVINYILNNPVAAGLVRHWQDWPHSYLHPDIREDYWV